MIRRLLALFIALAPAVASAQVLNWGDYTDSNQTIYVYFNTVGTDGVAETLTRRLKLQRPKRWTTTLTASPAITKSPSTSQTPALRRARRIR
jgi:hypothetical protein